MLGRQEKNKTEIRTVIGADARFQGDIEFSRGLQVDGIVVGNVKAVGDDSSEASISEKGVVEGTITVPCLSLSGTVVGDIYVAEHVKLGAKAKVIGNIRYKLIEMALGAEVNGRIVHESQESNDHRTQSKNTKIEVVPPLKRSGE
tara:strand:- start:52 stop:486 length:435 start_codon:yes stop_codon:yes gene_type:complete